MENFCKGHDILIKAVAFCIRQGYNIQLKIVGEGRYRPALEQLVNSLNLQPYVAFTGALPCGQAVAEQLDEADLFVLASRQEGLPRAMIEAMARGLPCIGSEVGGIPELLSPEDIVPRDNVEVLARKIQEILGNRKRSEEMSERNLERSRKYSEEQLRDQRRIFYTHVQCATEQWFETDRKTQGSGLP
jgi:glycosyltransferase involved in cell wall biosynthesis